jgi:hypothetical protein
LNCPFMCLDVFIDLTYICVFTAAVWASVASVNIFLAWVPLVKSFEVSVIRAILISLITTHATVLGLYVVLAVGLGPTESKV